MKRVQYKGYVFDPRVLPLEGGRLRAEVCLEEHRGPGVNIKKFFLENTFDTEEKARDHAVAGGRRMIDEGKV